MNKGPAKILEIAWLLVTILGASASVHSTINTGVCKSIILYVITFVGLLMYLVRRQYRQNQEDNS